MNVRCTKDVARQGTRVRVHVYCRPKHITFLKEAIFKTSKASRPI